MLRFLNVFSIIQIEIVNTILYGENYIHGQILLVHVQLDIMYQVIMNGKY